MKRQGHYCKVCGEYKANEKFSGKGHANHICKACAKLSVEERNREIALTRMCNLPWRLSKEQITWLKRKQRDKDEEVRSMAAQVLESRFPKK